MTTTNSPLTLLDLPNELLALIVDLAIPDYSVEPGAYSERCKTGRHLSLVCRALRPLAQAKLREACEDAPFARSDGHLAPELKRDLRSVSIYEETSLDDLSTMLIGCTALRDLSVSWHEEMDLSLLAGLAGLQRLMFFSVSVIAPRPFSFNSLVEFSCHTSYAHTNHPLITLDRSSFPKLQALGLDNYQINLSEDGPALSPADDLLAALTCVVFRSSHALMTSSLDYLHPYSDKVLREFDTDKLGRLTQEVVDAFSHFQHLRLWAKGYELDHAWFLNNECRYMQDDEVQDVITGLVDLANELDRRPPTFVSLKSLYLPTKLDPDLPSDPRTGDLSPRLQPGRDQLLAACRSAQVAVFFEVHPHLGCDSLVLPAFWERCKAAKESGAR
ncbi:hypothetical protein JCM6882_002698 [Rhodosporidiobolus microsporus]